GQPGTSCSSLSGTTSPFSAAKLAALYPLHARFVARWAFDTIADAARGFIRPADAFQLIAAAAASDIGGELPQSRPGPPAGAARRRRSVSPRARAAGGGSLPQNPPTPPASPPRAEAPTPSAHAAA